MTKLSINLNKFALLRNSRGRDYPNLVAMGKRCLAAGAHGLTIHPRPDERHARYADVFDLRDLIADHPGIELNIEGNPEDRFLKTVLEAKPEQCTLVPDEPDQITSDHGWNLTKDGDRLQPIIAELRKAGIRVSLFMDADSRQFARAGEIGADRVELYTEEYARAFGSARQDAVLDTYRQAASDAQNAGLGVNAGHDLDSANLGLFLRIPDILEVSIGHALVVESFDHGLEQTISTYLAATP